jgi:hypothetical protein
VGVPDTITCIDCGGECHRVPFDPPELGWEPGDIVRYRCASCADEWFLEIDEDQLTDD